MYAGLLMSNFALCWIQIIPTYVDDDNDDYDYSCNLSNFQARLSFILDMSRSVEALAPAAELHYKNACTM